LVTRFGSGAYSEKLFAGTRHRLFGFNQPRQCGDEVFRILVTGGRLCSVAGLELGTSIATVDDHPDTAAFGMKMQSASILNGFRSG
jgi:hypothetical protein